MTMTKFGENSGQICACLGQNLSQQIFHPKFAIMGVDLKFYFSMKILNLWTQIRQICFLRPFLSVFI